MSEALVGVVIGGLLSSLGTWITLAVQQRRWVTELRIARLQEKRDKLEEASIRALDLLPKAMAENSYPSTLMSDLDFLFSEPVSSAFNKMMSDKDKTELKMKHYYYNIACEMKKTLKDIDDEIDAVVLGKRPA